MASIEAVPTLSDSSPHGQLVVAFATLKKEKESIVALTVLQNNDNKALIKELESTKGSLAKAVAKIDNLEAKLELKSVSVECQIAEAESFSKDALQDAIQTNKKLGDKVLELEGSIAETKKEKEYLLKRTAVLARQDQLQKASLETSAKEVVDLTMKLKEFESRFSLLASAAVEVSSAYQEQEKEEGREEQQSSSSSEWARAKLISEKKEMAERITSLEILCRKLTTEEQIAKDIFCTTLSKYQTQWTSEREHLKKQIAELISEKQTIELQVAEIAEVLEREQIERYGSPGITDDEGPDEEIVNRTKPSGVGATQGPAVRNQ